MELDEFLPYGEVKKMRDFEKAYNSNCLGEITQAEAAALLGISERQFRRRKVKYEEGGEDYLAILDKRIGNIPPNKIPVTEVKKILNLYCEHYYDFNAKHFHEKLAKEHKIKVSYSWLKKTLKSNKLITNSKKMPKHRIKRERKPMIGMMLHQDASTHDWLNLGYNLDLVVTLDDATNIIYSAFLMEQEGTRSTFRGLLETFSNHGLANALYTDRGGHYTVTRKKDQEIHDTQVERALKQLSVTMIQANSPQARGRSERMFGTLQDRLPQELRVNKITTMEKANEFLKNKFIPQINKNLGKKPASKESAFIACDRKILIETLCMHAERVVNNDNTVSYNNIKLQIPKTAERHHYVKCTVEIHEYLDDTLAIFYGPRKIATYDKLGNLLAPKEQVLMGAGPHAPKVNPKYD